MLVKCTASSLLTLSLLAGSLHAQTTVPEIEPNGTKAEATVTPTLVAGDVLTGTTTGTSVTVGLTTDAGADTWRVKTAPATLGIYRHTLAITTGGAAGHIGTIRGVNQTNGVIGTVDSILQTSTTASTPARSNTWYGFGKQEEIYWRVTGTTSTTSPYSATLSTTPITPVAVPGMFLPGMVTITTYQQGHTTDTEIYLYDANLDPVPLGHNDGTMTSGIANSILVMPNLPAGTYYIAVSNYNTANNQSDLNPNDPYQSDPLLDFPDAMSCSSATTNLNVTFTVTDGTTSTQQPATKVNAFDIYWATFQVGNVSTPTTSYCSGDGSGTACPCGNTGLPGNGCASSVSANGANLSAAGVASVSADTFVLTGSDMPSGTVLYFQGTTRVNAGLGNVFGDGLRCAGGSVIRLGLETNVAGSSSYPGAGDPSISVKGMTSAGAIRDYQCWYRNAAAFCTPSTFNLTNGLEVTWTN